MGNGNLVGLISPHIDYPRGWRTYARTWQLAADAVEEAELVILLGTDHGGGAGALTLTRQNYATPWGVLPTARRILVRAGLSSPRHRRPPQHRCRRQRMPQEGMLLQLDGSHHLWLEDRGPWLTLLLAVDDATGTAPHALFQEQEDTRGYLSLLQGIIERQGVPMAVYTDGHAVFQPRRNTSDLSQVPRKGPSTQWGRALGELGITQILAHSP